MRSIPRIVFVVIACLIFLKISALSDENWRTEDYGDPLESMSKYLMTAGCSTPGLRVMCTPDGKDYPLDQLTCWDAICGCFFYSAAFVTFLWLMTPFPDISATVFLGVRFTQRREFEDEVDQEPPNIPGLNPAGGEGDVV